MCSSDLSIRTARHGMQHVVQPAVSSRSSAKGVAVLVSGLQVRRLKHMLHAVSCRPYAAMLCSVLLCSTCAAYVLCLWCVHTAHMLLHACCMHVTHVSRVQCMHAYCRQITYLYTCLYSYPYTHLHTYRQIACLYTCL